MKMINAYSLDKRDLLTYYKVNLSNSNHHLQKDFIKNISHNERIENAVNLKNSIVLFFVNEPSRVMTKNLARYKYKANQHRREVTNSRDKQTSLDNRYSNNLGKVTPYDEVNSNILQINPSNKP